MKLELKPQAVEVVKRHGVASNAGMSKDGQLSWTYKDGLLDVSLSRNSEAVASWRFGKALKDLHTSITCVTDLKYQDGYLLLVATSNVSDQGMLNIFSVGLKKVIRAIEIPQKVTAMEVVFSNVSEDVPEWVLSKHLQLFSGMVAVGTETGYIYLIDLCLDELAVHHSSEAMPKKLSMVSPRVVDPKAKRDQARAYDKHVALILDEQCHRDGHFYYRRQDDNIQKVLNEDVVCVTSLKYLSQAGTLAIGFNFGSFQLWKLYNPVLDYSSRYNPECKAVTGFVVQEPENDPRNFVYLWVAYGDATEESVANICLHQLCFTKKDVYANFGVFYDELESVCVRLDHNLTLDPYSSDKKSTWSSSIVSCYTVVNPFYKPPSTLSDSFEEGLHSNDLSLSVFVWRAEGKQGGGTPRYWMSIFDLNRWYHAQMPHMLRCFGSSLQVCPYWAVYRLDDIMSMTSSHNLLSVEISGDKVLRFINNSPLPPEEHSYPSSLQMTGVRFVMADGCVVVRCDGWQGQLLREMVLNGAEILVQPADFYHQCLRARLLPQSYEELKTSGVDYHRKMLLNMALEHGITSALVPQCIQQWSDGEFAEQGCTLSLLLGWAWDKVVNIKQSWDSTSEMLYDWSGHHLDPRTDWQLESLTEALSHLKQVFAALVAQSSPTTETGQLELEMRQDVINILLQHYEAVRWAISVNLLPEIDEDSDPLPGLFAYPVSELCEAYQKRRAELGSMKGIVDGFSLLLVDNLVECQGPHIKKVWERFGGNGLYPPPSMQALVTMYLVEEVSIEVKNAITLYLLQDLAALAQTDAGEAVVASFIQRFLLSPNMVHQVQGLWSIDHRDFEEGVRQMVNPNVHDDLGGSWMRTAVVNTLLAQAQSKAATRYLHTKGKIGGSPQEQQLYISVLINNRHVSQAMEFMRGCQNENSSSQLMNHLLKECQSNKLLGHLLQLDLTSSEEKHLEHFLRGRAEPHALEPLFLYYLHHSRFLQAYQLNEDMKRMDKLETSLAAQERASTRNRLMEAYLKALPDVTRKLLMEKQRGSSVSAARRVQVIKPQPLSTVVRNSDHMAMSRSHFVMAVLEKVTEAQQVVDREYEEEEDEEKLAKDVEGKRDVSKHTHDVPFLSTPRTSKHSPYSRLSQVIYPELKQSPMVTNPLSAAKRKTMGILDSEQLNGNVGLRQLTEECLQVLWTPIRDHKRKSISPGLASRGSQIKTPQSILKVRRLSKTLLPSSRDKSSGRRSSASHPRRLGSKSDSSLLISPATPPLMDKVTVPATTPLHEGTTATPKQLRFVGISPSPTPSPTSAFPEFPGSPSEEMSETSLSPPLDAAEQREPTAVQDSPSKTTVDEAPSSIRAVDSPDAHMEDEISQRTNAALTHEDAHGLPSFVEGPGDRYSDQLDELVRPDLQSPWKQGVVISEAHVGHTEVLVDDDITFNLVHTEEQAPLTPSMASSPKSLDLTDASKPIQEEAMEVTQAGGNQDDSSHVHSQVREITEQVSSSYTSEKHIVTFSKEVVKTTSKQTLLTVDTGISEIGPGKSARKSLSPLLSSSSHVLRSQRSTSSVSPTSSSPTAAAVASVRDDAKIRRNDSPPATPPSSKKAKMMISKSEDLDLLGRDVQSSPSPKRHEVEEPRRRKTPERRSPSRKSEIEDVQRHTPEQKSPSIKLQKLSEDASDIDAVKEVPEKPASPPRTRSKTPERRSPSRKIRKSSDVSDTDAVKELPDRPSSPPRTRQKTPDRGSASRKSQKVSEDISKSDTAKELPERSVSPPRTRRKTPDRQSQARKLSTLSESNDEKVAKEAEKSEKTIPLSPSRRGRKPSLSRAKGEDEAEKEETFAPGEEVLGKPPEADTSPEMPIRRRSTRLNTPERSVVEAKGWEPLSPARGRGRGAKTPQKISQKETEKEKVQDIEAKPSPGRRSTRQKISEVTAVGEESKSISPDRETTSSRKTRGESEDTSRSPGRQTRKRGDDKIEEKEESEEMEPHNLRRSRRQSKTPDRLIAQETAEPLTPTRKSKRHPRSPEKLNTKEIEPAPIKSPSVSPKRSSKEPASSKESHTPTRKSNKSKSPEAPLTPTRRSKRKPRSPDRLNTDEIEPFSPRGSPTRSPSARTQSSLEDKTPTRHSAREAGVGSSPSRTADKGKAEKKKTPVRSSHGRKTPDRKLQGEDSDVVERDAETDQSTRAQSKSSSTARSRKSPGRVTRSPGRKTRKASVESEDKNEDRGEDADEWNEEVLHLRLEVDEDENMDDDDSDHVEANQGFTKTKKVERERRTPDRTRELGKVRSDDSAASEDPLPPSSSQIITKAGRKASRKEEVAQEPSTQFVFSPPLTRSLRSHDNEEKGDKEETNDIQGHVFVFANPTVAVDTEEDMEANVQDSEEVDGEARTGNKPETKQKGRKKRALYHESPILLSPGSPVGAGRRLRKVPSDSQRASANILKRYKPRSRRIMPAKWVEPRTSGQ